MQLLQLYPRMYAMQLYLSERESEERREVDTQAGLLLQIADDRVLLARRMQEERAYV